MTQAIIWLLSSVKKSTQIISKY